MNPFHSSESAEWYTPAYIMDYVRRMLGPIDLDPCTTPAANKEPCYKWSREDD